MPRQSLLRGTFTLLFAGVFGRLMGFLPKLAIPRLAGTEALGLAQLVLPLLFFFLAFARFGLHVALPKGIAQAASVRDEGRMARLFYLAVGLTLGFGGAGGILLALLAEPLARGAFANPELVLPLRVAGLALGIMGMGTVLRAYFQGLSDMRPPAVAATVEVLVRSPASVLLAWLFLPYGSSAAAAGILAATLFGEVASLVYLAVRYRRDPTFRPPAAVRTAASGTQAVRADLRFLLREGWPVFLAQVIASSAYAAEPILVNRALLHGGASASEAAALYGELTGLAVFLVWFPTTFSYSLSQSLIPAMAEAWARRDRGRTVDLLRQSVRHTSALTFPFAAFFFFFASPLADVLFATPRLAPHLSLLALAAPFLYVQGPLGSALQALGWSQVNARNTLAASVLKLAAILALAPRPDLGIRGVTVAYVLQGVVLTALHHRALVRRLGFSPLGGTEGKLYVAALGSAAIGVCALRLLPAEVALGGPVQELLLSLLAAMLLYAFLAERLRLYPFSATLTRLLRGEG
ncbi:MAG: Stage V sporulation protein B [Brockia lithotrophica]|uniref:Stage V sporulation protein B n=1 Tax=Brockia lithotrophica TaxID=933949 RepID=A0A2T5G756_9BACL|nr:MAG: Stage V sporulation protein B [Brockia lithotrophica]